MRSHGRRAGFSLAALLGSATLVAGCGASAHSTGGAATTSGPTSVVAPTAPVTPTTTAPVPPATATPPATAPTTTTIVGLTLDGTGNTFTPPAAPTAKPYSTECQALVDVGFYGECLTVTGPGGTSAAVVEQQQQNYQPGQPITTGQERDLVYRRIGATWSLTLRRTPVAAGEAITRLSSSDIMRDGSSKAVFVEPAANSQFGNELDVVDGSGAVTLYRQLHGGFAAVPSGGGLDVYVPDPTEGYDETVVTYTGGSWKIASATHVSQSQAQAEGNQAFFDPRGGQPLSG